MRQVVLWLWGWLPLGGGWTGNTALVAVMSTPIYCHSLLEGFHIAIGSVGNKEQYRQVAANSCGLRQNGAG